MLSRKVGFSKQLRGWLIQDFGHFPFKKGPPMDLQSQPWGLGRKDGLSDPHVLLGKLALCVLTWQGACIFSFSSFLVSLSPFLRAVKVITGRSLNLLYGPNSRSQSTDCIAQGVPRAATCWAAVLIGILWPSLRVIHRRKDSRTRRTEVLQSGIRGLSLG